VPSDRRGSLVTNVGNLFARTFRLGILNPPLLNRFDEKGQEWKRGGVANPPLWGGSDWLTEMGQKPAHLETKKRLTRL